MVPHEKVRAASLSGELLWWMNRSVGVSIRRISIKKLWQTNKSDDNDIKVSLSTFSDQRDLPNESKRSK
jgi:hypothetical protein